MFEKQKGIIDKNRKNVNFETCIRMLSLYNDKLINRKYFKYIDAYKKASKKSEVIDFDMDGNLLEELYKNMNPNYTKKERILYLYFKLCFLLEMDDAYYFALEIDYNTLDEYFAKSPNRLKKINLENNKVNCFEFTEIMNKLIRLEGGIHKSYDCYGSGDHISCETIIDDFYFQFDSMNSLLDLIMVKLNKGFFGITTNCTSDIKNVVPEVQEVYNDVQREFLHKKEEKKFSEYTINSFLTYINMINIGEKEKSLLKEYILKINDINLNGIEFCTEVAREYSSKISKSFDKRITLKRFCESSSFGGYGFSMVLSVEQDDGTMIYFKFGDYDNLEVLSKEYLTNLIKENKLIVTKQGIFDGLTYLDIYRLIPGIDAELQKEMNKQASINIVPVVLKKVLEESIKNNSFLLKKYN